MGALAAFLPYIAAAGTAIQVIGGMRAANAAETAGQNARL